MKREAQLHRQIEQKADGYLSWLKNLISFPSPSGQEQACQCLVQEQMRQLGLKPQAVFIQAGPPFHPTRRDYDYRPNWVGHLPGSGSSRILLNAHIDTAPIENHDSWIHPPYAAVIEDGKLYGRGSLDDKAGIAMMMLLAEVFQDLPRSANLYFASVIEDEDSGNGTLACTQAGYWCDQAVILDGTWPFRAIDAHLGQVWLHAEISGKAAASCSWSRALNPIDRAIQGLQSLRHWITTQNRETPQWLEIVNPFFLSLGEFHSGYWPGATPESASISFQLGFPPPWTPEQIIQVAQEHLGPLRVGALCTPPYCQRPNPMAQRIQAQVERLRPSSMEFKIQAVTGHCDLRHVRRQDGSPAQACLYGPGGGGNPHVANEYYLLESFVPVAQNLASSLLHLMENC